MLGALLFGKPAPGGDSAGQTLGWVMALFALPFVLIGFGMMLAPIGALRSA